MKNPLKEMLFGKHNQISGLLALLIVGAVALGCTCGKNFDLANLAKNSGNASSTPPPFNSSDYNVSKGNTTVKSTPFSGKKADASKSEIPGDDQLQEMVRETLLDFNKAVLSDDFTDFYSTLCRPWKKQITAEALRGTFRVFVEKRIDIGAIRSLDAEFSPDPAIGQVVGFKTLKIFGTYQTRPNLTKFELNYIPEGKEWKLSKIDLDTTKKF